MARKDFVAFLVGLGVAGLPLLLILLWLPPQTIPGQANAAPLSSALFLPLIRTAPIPQSPNLPISNQPVNPSTNQPAPHHHPTGHAAAEGLILAPAAPAESDAPAPRCPADAPVRLFAVTALEVEITLNRYLDYDPQGRMYALAGEVERVRAEEAQNRAARKGDGEPGVSIGLQGDAIQPLILRAHPGDCLRVSLRNDLTGQPAGFHIHGASLVLTATGEAAVAANPTGLAAPGQAVGYEWYIAPDEPEGTHYFHSHGPEERALTSHGLFGALIVEPAGSRFLNPRTGAEQLTGWDAIIQTPDGSSFREFAIIYH